MRLGTIRSGDIAHAPPRRSRAYRQFETAHWRRSTRLSRTRFNRSYRSRSLGTVVRGHAAGLGLPRTAHLRWRLAGHLAPPTARVRLAAARPSWIPA